MTNDDLQNAIETIENCMDEWRSINWLRCSEDQLNKIRDDFKDLKDKLIIAGGLNNKSVSELEDMGIKKVLVGTALHSGEMKLLD